MLVVRPNKGIEKIKPHMVGGMPLPAPPPSILLNSNESVFGPGTNARAAAHAAVNGIERYLESPDTFLTPSIADRFGLAKERITVGQGSDDLLARLARTYLGPETELMRSVNGYLKVPNYAHAINATVVSVPDNHFKPSVERMISSLSDRTRIVYLANPENPAGSYLNGDEVRRLHSAIPDNALLVIDSAYEEYMDAADHEPPHTLVDSANNVVMCRTFSKIFGLAGARVGWMYGPEDIVDTIRRVGLTFPISSISAAAAIAALEDTVHTDFVYKANLNGRKWLTSALEKLGLTVIPSQANFILVYFPDANRSAKSAHEYLRQNGIAVRRFASPAFDDYIRITIGYDRDLKVTRNCLFNFLSGLT
jgi:histidinol-phosphate aminotransferase|tara:strand:- start:363 stop:1457 length:1095 start_codon:yes stop_codon:yes gene_type:complete